MLRGVSGLPGLEQRWQLLLLFRQQFHRFATETTMTTTTATTTTSTTTARNERFRSCIAMR